MPGSLAAPRSGRGTSSFLPMRRPAFRLVFALTKHCRSARDSRNGWKANTLAAEPCNIWRRGTCIAHACSAVVKRRPLRRADGHRSVRSAGGRRDADRTVRLGRTRLLDCRQRIESPRPVLDRSSLTEVFERDSGPYSGPCELAQSDRDLLFHRQRKVLSPNDFASLAEVEDRLLAFQDYYMLHARPFDWKFDRPKLNAFITRLEDARFGRLHAACRKLQPYLHL